MDREKEIVTNRRAYLKKLVLEKVKLQMEIRFERTTLDLEQLAHVSGGGRNP